MKYKVADKVRIKSLDWYNENKNEDGDITLIDKPNNIYNFIEEMKVLCGKVMTISNTKSGYYDMLEDDGEYFWTDEMIEGLANPTETTIKIKDLRKFINQMEIEGLNDETVLTFKTKRSSGYIENITLMEYGTTTNILIFS
jgi:hypothetical protein